MSQLINPVFSQMGSLEDEKYCSEWALASPWPEAEVAFHWSNFDYPRQHIHEYWEILCLISGTVQHEVNGCVRTLQAHHGCLLRPEDCHALRAVGDEPVIVLNFMAKKEYMQQVLCPYGKTLTEKVLGAEDLSFRIGEVTLHRCIADTQVLQIDAALSMPEKISRCKALFVRLVSDLMAENVMVSQSTPKWLSDFLILLSQPDYNTRSIKADLAKLSTYSYSRLIFLFKQHMGCTICQYMNLKRAERAKEYLRYTNMSVIDIAAALGCEHVTHFNRIFKSVTGLTPIQYRKKMQR